MYQNKKNQFLDVSIVTYDTGLPDLINCMSSVVRSLKHLRDHLPGIHTSLILVDNSASSFLDHNSFKPLQESLNEAHCELKIIQGHGNVGYGKAHNLAYLNRTARYHLFMNPDVLTEPESLSHGIKYLEKNADVGMVSPYAADMMGAKQFLCKRYPTVFDLFVRGFLPKTIEKIFNKRLAEYEMQELSESTPTKGIPIVSGCFMLCRKNSINSISGFDPDFFMYFEDFDFSIRIGKINSIAYLPHVKIRHGGGSASKKGYRHIGYFIASAIRFYSKYKWSWISRSSI